ncbi:hypothetical protein UY3_10042 [Chelonia mydas]|uniref:Uncharacterized protein n=1 Tax=Chelonia mydas TaxID=8469 RepID=M7BB19_CHEMY|nr:hypothetical protein UY3_10042 [Chelonia mydas]
MQGLVARMKQHDEKCSFSRGSCVEDNERNMSEHAGSSDWGVNKSPSEQHKLHGPKCRRGQRYVGGRASPINLAAATRGGGFITPTGELSPISMERLHQMCYSCISAPVPL